MIYSIQYHASETLLPVRLCLIGTDHLQEPIQRPHGLPFYQWFYCTKGSGEFIINHQKCILSKGQAALLYPDESHVYRGITEDWTLHFFAFDGPMCADLLKTLNMLESDVFHLSMEQIFLTHIQQLEQIYLDNKPDQKKIFSTICYDFLLDLSLSISRIDTRIPVIEHPLIQRIMLYLEENYASPITITSLSEHLQLSREYLCTVFKKVMKKTIMQQLFSIRISHARHFLIQYPEKRSYEIASMCGFEDASYFIRVFRKAVGCTPEEYRMRNRF